MPRAAGTPAQTGVSVTPYMMAAGDEKVIADRLVAVLSKPPAQTAVDGARGAGGRPDRPVERADPVRRRDVDITRCT